MILFVFNRELKKGKATMYISTLFLGHRMNYLSDEISTFFMCVQISQQLQNQKDEGHFRWIIPKNS